MPNTPVNRMAAVFALPLYVESKTFSAKLYEAPASMPPSGACVAEFGPRRPLQHGAEDRAVAAADAINGYDSMIAMLRESCEMLQEMAGSGHATAAKMAARIVDALEAARSPMYFMLDGDIYEQALAARLAGWRIDADLFWHRPKRDGDVEIGGAAYGFVNASGPHVRSARMALDYDHNMREGIWPATADSAG